MTGKPRDYEEELRRLCDAMADAVAGMDDEQILAEAREEGTDPAARAAALRRMVADTVEDVRLRPLRAARAEYERERAALKGRTWTLPDSPAERRALLQHAFTKRPELQGLLTAAARELRDLPDDDVASILRNLAALGGLDDIREE